MKHLPSLKAMYYLVKLHEHHHFSNAAKACSVTQSTLSIGIQTLEKQLGSPVLERQHKSFVFTETGEQVVENCKTILSQTYAMMDLVKSSEAPYQGTLHLGAVSTILPFVIPTVIKQMQKQFPDITVTVNENVSERLIEQLLSGDIDIALVALPGAIRDMHCHSLGKEPLIWVAHNKHVTPLKGPVNLGNIPPQSLFMLDEAHCLYHHVMDKQKEFISKLHPNRFFDLNSLIQMTHTYEGVTCLPKMAIDESKLQALNLSVIQPENNSIEREICLVWRPSTQRVKTFKAVGALIEQQLNVLNQTRPEAGLS